MEGIRAGRRGSQRHVRTRGLGNQEGHQFYWVEKQRVPQFREICSGKKKKKKPNPTRFEKYVQIPRTRFRKRSQGTRNRGAEGRPDLGIRRKSTAPSVQETAQNVTSAEKAGEGTHHSLSPSPRETPAGPPAPALRAPRLRACAPAPPTPPRDVPGMDETSRPVPQTRCRWLPSPVTVTAPVTRPARRPPCGQDACPHSRPGPNSLHRGVLLAAPASPHRPRQTPLRGAAASRSHGPHRPQLACPWQSPTPVSKRGRCHFQLSCAD